MYKKLIQSTLMLIIAVLISCMDSTQPAAKRTPNIVFFLADDLGWKDVGYHGSEIQTPNIDRMAARGVRLEQMYAMPLCTPTRACLMTGRYPMRMGLQTYVILPWDRYGLPLEERTLPEALKAAGYRTGITGKWHLGHFDPAYLPTRRGFDHQYGLYLGMVDYYTHANVLGGLDWHRNGRALREEGYSTDLIAREAVRLLEGHHMAQPLFLYVAFNAPHLPLQAPREYVDRYQHIQDTNRRTYAAMVTCMDNAIGQVLAALDKRKMTDNTLVIFSSDNGGSTNQSAADNGRLRGGKLTLYEGGMRVPAWVVWPGKLKSGLVNQPLHVVDWYPTLLRLAGASLQQPRPLDGKDIWPTIAEGKPSPHEEILLNYEADGQAIRRGDWKLVIDGQRYLDWDADARKTKGKVIIDRRIELFNIAQDPYEETNMAGKHPEKVQELLARLQFYERQAVPGKRTLSPDPPARFKAPTVWGEKE
ncbi:MAG: arylsulfatase [Acidobacteria bacterium]|nr:arylsulfatase [Acidobacteriota bacterium]MBI3655296.1 arylsulfatase [Acidobacteriota bacterium]